MVGHFERIVMQGMGLRSRRNLMTCILRSTGVLYIAQTCDPALEAKAERAAASSDPPMITVLQDMAGWPLGSHAVTEPFEEIEVAQMITLYWRDIPAQVIAERGRGRKREQAKIELHRRFAIAIDAAAMRDGAIPDDYLAEWRRGGPRVWRGS